MTRQTAVVAERRTLHPHVCCDCRVSFRYSPDEAAPPCPECGRVLVRLDPKFSAPPRRQRAQWAKVAFLIEHGFDFRRVYERDGDVLRSVDYPASLAAARGFVERELWYADRARAGNR